MIDTIKKLGKVPIVTADVPCFAADDIFCNYISEAARMAEEGLASTGYDDLSLAALSCGDYRDLEPLLAELMARYGRERSWASCPTRRWSPTTSGA